MLGSGVGGSPCAFQLSSAPLARVLLGGWNLPDVGDVPCPQDAQEFSDVERAIETLIKNFHQYSVEGGKETLTASELQDLVTQQLPHLMPVLSGPLPRQRPDFPSKVSKAPPTVPRPRALAAPSPSPCQCQAQVLLPAPGQGGAGRLEVLPC